MVLPISRQGRIPPGASGGQFIFSGDLVSIGCRPGKGLASKFAEFLGGPGQVDVSANTIPGFGIFGRRGKHRHNTSDLYKVNGVWYS